MIIQRLITMLFLIYLIDANPVDQSAKQYQIRRRRSVDLMNWQTADTLFKQLYLNNDLESELHAQMRRTEIPPELRPVEGPISIEQLPAMLAARSVKRYPYSRQDDPAIIGR